MHGRELARSELLLDHPIQIFRDRRLIEPLDYFVEKPGDDEALGGLNWDAAGTEIEKFVFVDLAAGGAVSAADVVGQNFEAGHGVGLGVIAQKKISHFLVGVGEVGMWLDS